MNPKGTNNRKEKEMIDKEMKAKLKKALDNFFRKGDRTNSFSVPLGGDEIGIVIRIPGKNGEKDKGNGNVTEELEKVMAAFADLRDKYADVDSAIEATCLATKLDRKNVLDFLVGVGLYVPPGSEREREIKKFIDSVERNKTMADEVAKETAFRFCISSAEAKRLVKKWYVGNIH